MTYGEDLSECIYCHQLKPVQEMQSIFKTGFVQDHGVSYPLGICTTCHQRAAAHLDVDAGHKTK